MVVSSHDQDLVHQISFAFHDIGNIFATRYTPAFEKITDERERFLKTTCQNGEIVGKIALANYYLSLIENRSFASYVATISGIHSLLSITCDNDSCNETTFNRKLFQLMFWNKLITSYEDGNLLNPLC